MPLVNVQLYEGRLDDRDADAELIAKLTEVVVDVFGPSVRAAAWVVLHEVPSARCDIGGCVEFPS